MARYLCAALAIFVLMPFALAGRTEEIQHVSFKVTYALLPVKGRTVIITAPFDGRAQYILKTKQDQTVVRGRALIRLSPEMLIHELNEAGEAEIYAFNEYTNKAGLKQECDTLAAKHLATSSYVRLIHENLSAVAPIYREEAKDFRRLEFDELNTIVWAPDKLRVVSQCAYSGAYLKAGQVVMLLKAMPGQTAVAKNQVDRLSFNVNHYRHTTYFCHQGEYCHVLYSKASPLSTRTFSLWLVPQNALHLSRFGPYVEVVSAHGAVKERVDLHYCIGQFWAVSGLGGSQALEVLKS
ncbi:MAG: hypothetical protein COV52_06910 [Gammaproteobacteria bacterium CG11_big_fil_rev_8_21_14_0_20_46_22]|nr:MAG: hypothetical protein COW05_02290 [Gammaproteobacteria bacterium CG12_big_fil_rev_8_21_14_0_65_46_12]PIR10770.1 MAG: hypothetical protein COV52_06910 [Gammaproteobacteria bacterium CG11_big_fil_rev_8_21_14_0_20_46_22]